jgi:predicted glycosyltransferase
VTERPWRVVVGAGVAQPAFEDLRRAAPAHVAVERARPDFRALLARAAVSVSQAGYNTAVDLLRTGVAAVLVPFEAGHETEQRLRAECLSALGLARPAAGSRAFAADPRRTRPDAACGRAPPRPQIRLDGAERAVALVEELARSAAPSRRPAASCRLVAARRCAPPHRRRRPDRRNLVARRRCRRPHPGARSVARGGTRV